MSTGDAVHHNELLQAPVGKITYVINPTPPPHKKIEILTAHGEAMINQMINQMLERGDGWQLMAPPQVVPTSFDDQWYDPDGNIMYKTYSYVIIATMVQYET